MDISLCALCILCGSYASQRKVSKYQFPETAGKGLSYFYLESLYVANKLKT